MLERSKQNFTTAPRHSKDKNLIKLLPKKPKQGMLACDTEDNSKGNTYMVNFFDGKDHYTFRSLGLANNWLLEYSKKYKKGVQVWFANMAYDIGNLFREDQSSLSFNIAGSRFITGKIYQERVFFRDIFNVIPGSSVKKLGILIGLPKIEVEGDFNNEYYCQRDTEIVFWAKLKYQKALSSLNIELKNTAAATGFSALLKKYQPLQYNNFSDEDHAFLHRGYYGGRTEVFTTSSIKGKIQSYDIISSYPFAMIQINPPNIFCRYYTKRPKFNLQGMCELEMECPDNILPYLPVKYDNKLIFPRGHIQGTYTYFEINQALKLGYKIKKIHKAMEFHRQHDFTFKEFIDLIFKRRQKAKKEKDPVMDYACKIIMNASYGKFALGNEKTELVPLEQAMRSDDFISSEIFPNNQVIMKKITKYSPTTNYYIAAMITAIGRDRLYKYLLEGQKHDRVLLYCDTDSVFFSGSPFPDKMLGRNLGDLELQHSISEAQFILPKTYYVKFESGETIYKCKGVWGELAKKFFTEGYVEKMTPLKYVETCRKNFYIEQRNKKFKTREKFLPFNLWVNKPKSMKSKYDKRTILKNGETTPLILTTSDYASAKKGEGKNAKSTGNR